MANTTTFECTTCCPDCVNIDCAGGCCVPTTLFATISNNAGCACLHGVVVELTYNEMTEAWEGSASACSTTITLSMTCGAAPNMFMAFTAGCSGTSAGVLATSCDPFSATFSILVGTCCTGSVSITVTE